MAAVCVPAPAAVRPTALRKRERAADAPSAADVFRWLFSSECGDEDEDEDEDEVEDEDEDEDEDEFIEYDDDAMREFVRFDQLATLLDPTRTVRALGRNGRCRLRPSHRVSTRDRKNMARRTSGRAYVWVPPVPATGSKDVDEERAGDAAAKQASWVQMARHGADAVAARPAYRTAPAFSPNDIAEATLRSLETAHAPVVLECGLTAAQVRALMSRELSPEDYELLLQLDAQVKAPTAAEDVVERVLARSQAAAAVAECLACLLDIGVGDASVSLERCGHVFHHDCIASWLRRYNRTCPVCRDAL